MNGRYEGNTMKGSEFRRQLEKLGVEIIQGTNHLKLYYNGNRSIMPRHPSKEIKEGTRRGILKQLGIK
ncbi:type II toxin-antitoxin system HicA family toxin [Marinomonas shanghaiensis]|uniref:type II toxin-antitoxin system HicA family toxin n=1 Tax=Marinomonas shanghaiensis TaxID=2202418 RepID=UPI003A93F61B